MKVSLSWLTEYITITLNAAELSDALTMAGLEVDSVADRFAYLNDVVLCRITQVAPHPNADRLRLCRVDIGDRVIDVVCGAPNARENMLTACALPGASLPNGLVIKKGVIRGETSEGMLCSQFELELSADRSGIMDIDPEQLADGWALGSPLAQALDLSDIVFEIDLTPNRPDCLSIIGTAREIRAFQKNSFKLNYPVIALEEAPQAGESIHHFTSVDIQAPHFCPRYAARLVRGIKVAPSPFWLQDRLRSIGMKPINNIVDITNFVMMETGQPLHAFDFDRLAENRIVVRTAQQGERFTTLDNKTHQLDPEMLMICDGQKPVALAGVMGGLNSEIEPSTADVLIESAYFDPACIRKTAKKIGLHTDAAHRFERGVDPEGTLYALNRAAALMVEIGGGTLIREIIDENPQPYQNKRIVLSTTASNRRLGTNLTRDQIEHFLTALEFSVSRIGDNDLQVIPPSFRVDVSRPEDLMEEVARLWGYNNIETTFPLITTESQPPSKSLMTRQHIKILMTGLGFNEAINYSFVHKDSCDRLDLDAEDPRRKTIEILNPLSEDQAVMRTSLIPGLLETMKRNVSVQNKSLKLFEIGRIFLKAEPEDLPNEVEMLAGLWTGNRIEASWFSKEVGCDFYDLKGVVEELLINLGLNEAKFARLEPQLCRYTKPGYTAAIFAGDASLGLVAEVHPQVLKNYDLKQSAYIFELDINQLIQLIPDRKCAQAIPKFPSTSRDVTLIVNADIEADGILSSVKDMRKRLVEEVKLLDVYEKDPIPAGKKSISFRIIYRSTEETLQDDTVNDLHKDISDRLLAKFEASLPV